MQRRASKRSTWKIWKSFWRRKRKKLLNALDQNKNLSEEEKEKKCQYGRGRYKNLLEDGKQWLVEYTKNFEFLLCASSYSSDSHINIIAKNIVRYRFLIVGCVVIYKYILE